jgi:hypothetical protein
MGQSQIIYIYIHTYIRSHVVRALNWAPSRLPTNVRQLGVVPCRTAARLANRAISAGPSSPLGVLRAPSG